MSNIKVSVIIPVYNSDKYIKNTIKSIINQSLPDIEIICINDGSTDNSKSILDELSVLDNRIKVVHQENKGVSYTRNKGISIASGKYLGFVDSDDIIDTNMYETLYNKATEFDCDIVCSGLVEETLDGTILRKSIYKYHNDIIKNEDIKSKLVESLNNDFEILGGASMCTKLYKKILLTNNSISIDESISVGEDLCFNLNAFYHAKCVAGVSDIFYHYMNVNTNSIMRSNNEKTFIRFIEGRKFILETLNKYGFNSKNYTQFEYGRNFANLIQIADFRLRNESNFKNKYKESINILKSDEIKKSISITDNKYLSKNLQILKKLIQSNMYFLAFSILYTRSNIKK